MKKPKQPPSDYCVACKKQMHRLPTDGIIKVCFICVNENCPRVGLLSVVGMKLVSKGEDKQNDKQNGEVKKTN